MGYDQRTVPHALQGQKWLLDHSVFLFCRLIFFTFGRLVCGLWSTSKYSVVIIIERIVGRYRLQMGRLGRLSCMKTCFFCAKPRTDPRHSTALRRWRHSSDVLVFLPSNELIGFSVGVGVTGVKRIMSIPVLAGGHVFSWGGCFCNPNRCVAPCRLVFLFFCSYIVTGQLLLLVAVCLPGRGFFSVFVDWDACVSLRGNYL